MLTYRLGKMLLTAAFVAGVLGTGAVMARAADLVSASASVSPASVARGGHGTLTVTLKIADGAHVNAHKLANADFIPTDFTPTSTSGVKFAAPKYPAAHETTTAGMKMSVYEGTAKIVIPFTVAKTAKPGTLSIGGPLTYQACNSAVCFPPKHVDLTASITVK